MKLLKIKKVMSFFNVILMIFAVMMIANSPEVHADNDCIYFPQNIIYVDEATSQSSLPVMVIIDGRMASLIYSSSGITATEGVDYKNLYRMIAINNPGIHNIELTVYDDAFTETDEEFIVTLTCAAACNDPANGMYSTCTVVIIDDDGITPPQCQLLSHTASPAANQLLQGTNMQFELSQNVSVTDTLSSGPGWELLFSFNEFLMLESDSIDDPCLPGFIDYMKIKIPVSECITGITLTEVIYPDSTVDGTDVIIDLLDVQSTNGVSVVQVAEDDSYLTGTFNISFSITLEIDYWLPEGTIITAGGNGSRFDGNYADAADNDYIVQPGDQIQIFSGNYNWNFDYDAVRPSSP